MKTKTHPQGRDAIVLTIDLDPKDLRLVPTPYGVLVRLEGFTSTGEIGGPSLPERILHVALPDDAAQVGVEVERGPVKTVAGPGTSIAPQQEPQLASRDAEPVVHELELTERTLARRGPRPPRRPLVEARPELYRREASHPRPLADLTAASFVGATPMATLRIAPMRIAEDGSLQLFTRIVVRLVVAPKARPTHGRGRGQESSPSMREIEVAMAPALSSRSQAKRQIDLAEALAVNRGAIARYDLRLPLGEAEYLVLTDDHHWDATTMTRLGPVDGDMIAEYQRLVQWKRARGLSARLVTIGSIVRNHGSGARDLQEAIRAYLVHAHAKLGTTWVLLGGDVSVVPVRTVLGSAWGGLGTTTNAKPDDGQVSWSGSFMRLHWTRANEIDEILRSDTGAVIPRRAGTTGSGWYYVTSDTYATASTTPTDFVRIDGSASAINGPLMVSVWDNQIATDFYYASLRGKSYGQPGLRDWDRSGNGIYGQHNGSGSLDGVMYHTDVSVGRAPTGTALEAKAFVDKVIAYERGETRGGHPLDSHLTRVVYAASVWGGRNWIGPAAGALANESFEAITGANMVRIQLTTAPTGLTFRVLSHVSETDIRQIPYGTSGRGWYFATNATSTTPSQVTAMGSTSASPTRWIIVRGDAAELAPQGFILDEDITDGSIADTQDLRARIEDDFGFYESTRLYEDELGLASEPDLQHLTAARLEAALEQGPHLVCLSGHGSHTGVAALDTPMAARLTNDAPFIAYADSCLTNRFDVEDSMSEALITNPNGGAVAYVGNTRYSWIGVGDDFERDFFRCLATARHLGVAHDARCAMLGATTSWFIYHQWVAFTCHLLGDPEMRVHVLPPLRIPFDVPIRELPRRRPLPWKVPRELLDDTVVLEDVRVTLRQRDHVARLEVGPDGAVELDASSLEPGEVELTVSVPRRPAIVRRLLVE